VGDHDRLLKLITEHCTADQVKELLRTAIGNKNVKVSAANKEDLVAKNLREALDSHSIDVEKVYDLLREAEENGPQHIFYLRCPSKDVVQHLTLNHVQTTLLGKSSGDHPRLDVKRNDYVIADVRRWSDRKPQDWAVKIYGHETREEPTGEIIRESASRILKVFEQKEYRYVLLARWNAPDLLELRVPRDSSIIRIDRWRNILEERLRMVVPFDRFKPWSLKGVSKALFDEQAKNKYKYRLGDAQLEDTAHNFVTFQSFVPDSDLFGAAATQSAAQGLLDHDAVYRHQRVLWLEVDPRFPVEISCLIGSRAENEVVFFRHQTSRGIDYVTSQLRAFSRR
jgi:hypothetical protein